VRYFGYLGGPSPPRESDGKLLASLNLQRRVTVRDDQV
jgi:hypothetical protein